MQTVITTPTFLRQAGRAGVTEDELIAIVDAIAKDPIRGDLVEGTGGARKLRHRREGSGKSGGYRTIHYFAGADVPVFLLAIYGKGDRANITKAERNELAAILPGLAADYRRSRRRWERSDRN